MNHSSNSVRTIMTREVLTVHEEDSCLKIRDIFRRNSVHHVVVMSKDEISGIISNNDLLKMYSEFYDNKLIPLLSQVTAKDIMTPDPLTIESEDSIGLAADIFLANELHSIPVVDNGDLVGILTNHDLLKYSFRLV